MKIASTKIAFPFLVNGIDAAASAVLIHLGCAIAHFILKDETKSEAPR